MNNEEPGVYRANVNVGYLYTPEMLAALKDHAVSGLWNAWMNSENFTLGQLPTRIRKEWKEIQKRFPEDWYDYSKPTSTFAKEIVITRRKDMLKRVRYVGEMPHPKWHGFNRITIALFYPEFLRMSWTEAYSTILSAATMDIHSWIKSFDHYTVLDERHVYVERNHAEPFWMRGRKARKGR